MLSGSHCKSELANIELFRTKAELRLWICILDLFAQEEKVTPVYGGNHVSSLLRRSQPAFLIQWYPSNTDLNNLTELLLGKRCILYQNCLQFDVRCMIMPCMHAQHLRIPLDKVFWYVSRIDSPVRSLLYQALKSTSVQIHFCMPCLWISALPKLNGWAHWNMIASRENKSVSSHSISVWITHPICICLTSEIETFVSYKWPQRELGFFGLFSSIKQAINRVILKMSLAFSYGEKSAGFCMSTALTVQTFDVY